MQRTQVIVRGVILLLFVLLAFLLYYYWRISSPPTQVGADQAAGVTHVFSMYGYGSKKEEQLFGPDALAVDEKGSFYVSDSGNSRIMVFDRSGKFVRVFGKKGTGKGEMLFPLGIAAANGRVYVASMIASKLQIYSTQGKLLREVLVDRPIRVKVRSNRLWISTPGQIWLTDLNGNVLRTYFRKGKNPGELNYPQGIGFDSKGNVFISDSLNNRVQIIDNKGNLVGMKGEPTKKLNQEKRLFGLGMGLAIDEQDRIYVADAFHSSIQVFNHNGANLAELGVQGSNDGQMDHPSDIVYLSGDRFAVADKNNDRVQVLALTPPSRPGAPVPTGRSWIPFALLALALLIIGWIVWRLLRMRQVKEASPSF